MNISSLFGFLIGMGVIYGALHATTDNLKFFLDEHGILIVMGGTLAAASISFPIKDVLLLFKVFFMRVLGAHKREHAEVINQLLELNKKASLGVTGLNDMLPSIKNPFLREAVSLVATGVLNEHEIRTSLEQRLKTIEAQYMHEANMFKTIGRFPPAFGLLATTLGMIGVLQKSVSPTLKNSLAPAMSIGLIGTLYGISLANLVFLPIGENLTERTHEEVLLRKMIVEGAVMLKQQVNPMTMRESLNSFYLPKDRVVRKAA